MNASFCPRAFLRKPMALALAGSVLLGGLAHADTADDTVTVYKSPTCGCCQDWVDHMKDNDFEVTVHETNSLNPIKKDAGITPRLASCHTAFVGDYVIEGHVPASDVRKLLSEAPRARGLAVPGMPVGSPGMEMGDRQDSYNVLLFNEQGQARVFSSY